MEKIDKKWTSGFFDAEGCVQLGVWQDNTMNTNYKIAPTVKIEHRQIAGYFDGDGMISSQVKRGSYTHGYGINTVCSMAASGYSAEPVEEAVGAFLKNNKIDFNIYKDERESENHSPTVVISIRKLEEVEKFLTLLENSLFIKKTQADIMLHQIIPRLNGGEHLNKEGFLEVIAWKECMDSYKGGGKRSKYNLQYFEDKWDMTLPEKKKPRYKHGEDIEEYSNDIQIKSIREW